MQALTLDPTLPNSDAFRSPTNAGRVRYVEVSDALTLAVLNRVFGDLVHRTTLIADKVNELVGAANETSGTGDASRNILSSGTVPFTKPQRGVDPTLAPHLTTKRYVDSQVLLASTAVETLTTDFDEYKDGVPLDFASPWVTFTWQAGAHTVVDLALGVNSGKVLDPSTVSSIVILERLDIAIPTNAVPSPAADYVYRQLDRGTNGFAVEDMWLIPGSRTVRLLAPNGSGYDPSYLNSGYDRLQTPRSRALKAVVRGAGLIV